MDKLTYFVSQDSDTPRYAVNIDAVELTGVLMGLSRYVSVYRTRYPTKYRGDVLITATLPKQNHAVDKLKRLDAIAALHPDKFPDYDVMTWVKRFRKPQFHAIARLVAVTPYPDAEFTHLERLFLRGKRGLVYQFEDIRPYTGELVPVNFHPPHAMIHEINDYGEIFAKKLTKIQIHQLYDLCERLEYNQRQRFLGKTDMKTVEGHAGWFILDANCIPYRNLLLSYPFQGNISTYLLTWRKEFMRLWGDSLDADLLAHRER